MRHQFITSLFAIVLLVASVSCVKQETGTVPPMKESRVSVFFTIEQAPLTRASAQDVTTLERVDVLVFRSGSGSLDSHLETTGRAFSVSVPKDVDVTWYIIGNAPEGAFDSVSDLSSLSSVYAHLSDMTGNKHFLSATGRMTYTDETSQEISLERLLCRVSLGTVKPEYYAPSSFEIERVYLINAVEGLSFDANRISGLWYNRLAFEPGNSLSCLEVTVGKINEAESISVDADLLCFPNPTVADTNSSLNSEWSPRHTRLIIEARVDGELEYFPVTLPVMRRNTTYRINTVIITGPGTSHPDTPIDRTSIESTITITPWGSAELDVPLE